MRNKKELKSIYLWSLLRMRGRKKCLRSGLYPKEVGTFNAQSIRLETLFVFNAKNAFCLDISHKRALLNGNQICVHDIERSRYISNCIYARTDYFLTMHKHDNFLKLTLKSYFMYACRMILFLSNLFFFYLTSGLTVRMNG